LDDAISAHFGIFSEFFLNLFRVFLGDLTTSDRNPSKVADISGVRLGHDRWTTAALTLAFLWPTPVEAWVDALAN